MGKGEESNGTQKWRQQEVLATKKPVRRIVVPGKPEAVQMFVNGLSIADIAAQTCNHRLRIEQVLREAIQGLAALKVPAPAEAVSTTPVTISDSHSVDIDRDGHVTEYERPVSV